MSAAPVVQWLTPSPLWREAMDEPSRMRRPAILRFASDTFMDDLATQLERDPASLGDRVADVRSYRRRPPGTPAEWQPRSDGLKLYQPIHGHFNLVATSLVCRIPGMPDRTLDVAAGEEAGFVLRRLVPVDGGPAQEAAWVDDPTGTGWRSTAGDPARIVAGEQVLPLFPVRFRDTASRRLLVGLIPTSGAEAFTATGALSPLTTDRDQAGAPVDPRVAALDTRVIGPLEALREADLVPSGLSPEETARAVAAARAMTDDAARFILLDLAELLDAELPLVWAAVLSGSPPAGRRARALHELLETSAAGARGGSLRAALATAWAQRLRIAGEAEPPPTLDADLATSSFDTAELRARFAAALPARPGPAAAAGRAPGAAAAAGGAARAAATGATGPAAAAPAAPPAARPAAAPDAADAAARELPRLFGPGARFIVRPVLRRPRCRPVPVDLVGEPTEPFAIASFFDPDAPARTIRIQMPIGTAIADLRRYPRNVGFVISDQLREQMNRVTDLKRTMDGQLASGDSFDVGMLCSFSIPIITICALIVLLIFVSLLNIVFWWMPFLRLCLPIALPGKRS